jgi:tetratricopeptide (TPR) repeat protein
LGACYSELKQYDKAIAVFKQAIEIDPNHASSEFQMARAMQRSGDVANAKEHFKRFQHLQSTKIGAAIGLAYGEQGHYSIVTPVAEPQAVQKAMIPVKLVAQPENCILGDSAEDASNRPPAAHA